MKRTRRVAIAIVTAGTFAIPGLLSTGPSGAATPGCLSTPTRVLSGDQPSFTSNLVSGERVDARLGTWTSTPAIPMDYAIYFDTAGEGSCWLGGKTAGPWGISTTWARYHDTAGFAFGGPYFSLEDFQTFNYGDGIRVRDDAAGFAIRGAYMSYIHDDCVENDRLVSGLVTDSLLDGCYVGFSARPSDGDVADGRTNTWTITNTLVRLQAMPSVYGGTAPGHGGFFKWDNESARSPKLVIRDSIFRADQNTNSQDLQLPAGYDVTCSNNKMVWLGTGSFPGTLPSCFTITTNRSVWDQAVATWRNTHTYVKGGPEVSIGDSSVVEGDSGTRSFQFHVGLSAAPGVNPGVVIYYTTATGTAGTSDFTAKKGKITFTGNQVSKVITIPIKPDTVNESNETMRFLIAGIENGVARDDIGVGTILNDDSSNTQGVSISDGATVEGDSGTRSITLLVSLRQPATSDVVITYTTLTTGSATSGIDYTPRTGSVTINATKTFKTITIPIISDSTSEGDEQFAVSLTSATGMDLFRPVGTVTIVNDD
ncbi:MAG: hypothetical protein EXQ69_07545 [Acidimicrobiia bacterium]|nr:hypothetical protein [Acidimicrobiia bacterium]